MGSIPLIKCTVEEVENSDGESCLQLYPSFYHSKIKFWPLMTGGPVLSKSRHNHLFTVRTSGGVIYLLQASTREEMVLWIRDIREASEQTCYTETAENG